MLTPPDLEREIGLTGIDYDPIFKRDYMVQTIFDKFSHHSVGGNIFHGAMGLDSLFLMRPVKGW